MVRKKQDGPELKLCQIDTLRYLTTQNIKQGIFDLTEFVKKGGASFSQQKQIPVGKVFEFFCKNNHDMVGISNDVKIGSAYDTWLRKSGLLNSQNNKYELSDIGISLQSSSLSMQSYCFLLISKQWLIITDDERNKIYGRNLLCVLIELFKKKNSIKKDSFVTTIGEEGIRLYRKQYEGIKLANLEGARYLEDPLKISCIIEEKNGYYQLTESFTEIAEDYLSKEEKIRPPSTLKLLDDRYECYLNQLRFGFYDLIGKNNINLYMKTYPDLFQMTYQKIYFGAPGTGKSHKIDYNLFKDKDGNLIGKGIKEIPEDRKFRTTFHPDYDYAQFVGAYKPKKVQNIDNGTLSKDQLAQKLSDVFPNNGDAEIDKTTAITLFGLQYANSLKGKNMNEIVRLSKIGEDQYKSAYLSAAVKARLQLSDVDEKITYSFVPQVFAKAYAAAWKQYFAASNVSTANNQVYLVIEEINRGNCAQIFGDIFQLLDRKDGYSDYPIDVDSDFASYIKEQLSNVKQSDGTIANYWDAYKSKIQEWDSSEQDEEFADGDFCKIALPPNLNILATMNTSDQSLFPMDSAFKRRFDWEYVPINYDHPKAHFAIKVGNTNYDWLDFLKKINENIDEVTKSEDKKLGEFFIKPKDGKTIDLEEFRSKVLFYLWDSVYKDEDGNTDAEKVFHFNIEDGKKDKMTFQKLFDREKGVQYVNTIMGKDHLNVDQYKENDTPVTDSQHSSETTINTDTGTAEETTDDTAEPAQT